MAKSRLIRFLLFVFIVLSYSVAHAQDDLGIIDTCPVPDNASAVQGAGYDDDSMAEYRQHLADYVCSDGAIACPIEADLAWQGDPILYDFGLPADIVLGRTEPYIIVYLRGDGRRYSGRNIYIISDPYLPTRFYYVSSTGERYVVAYRYNPTFWHDLPAAIKAELNGSVGASNPHPCGIYQMDS